MYWLDGIVNSPQSRHRLGHIFSKTFMIHIFRFGTPPYLCSNFFIDIMYTVPLLYNIITDLIGKLNFVVMFLKTADIHLLPFGGDVRFVFFSVIAEVIYTFAVVVLCAMFVSNWVLSKTKIVNICFNNWWFVAMDSVVCFDVCPVSRFWYTVISYFEANNRT